jgi:hypothetical protein
MTSLRFRLTYKDDEPEVMRLLSPCQLGQQWGTQVSHNHEKGDGGSRQVTDNSKLETQSEFFLHKNISCRHNLYRGIKTKKISFGYLKLKQYN